MESGVRNEEITSEDSNYNWLRNQIFKAANPWVARYIYGVLFLITNVLAWAIRDYGPSAFTELKRLELCQGSQECVGADGVLRVSLGCFTFYFIMFLTTAGTSILKDSRESWHSGWWSAKFVLWIFLLIVSFFIPFSFIQIYEEVAHFGAGIFLLIQLISIISFIKWLNDCCHSYNYGCHIHVMLLATCAYIICIAGIIMMYIWYVPEASCFLNIFFITWTLILLQLMTTVSLHPKVNAGVLTPGLMGLYIVFICWSAIRSEPPGRGCDKKIEDATKADWLTIISFIIALLAMVIATFSTGIDSQCFQCRKGEKTDGDIPYGYGFFHFVFATGSMYLGMLLISWNKNHTMRKWTIDVGWTSTWVRIVNEWLAVCVYIWMLVAPIIWKNRQPLELV